MTMRTRMQAPSSAFAISNSRSLLSAPRDATFVSVGTAAAGQKRPPYKSTMTLAALPFPIKSWLSVQAELPTSSSSLNPAQLTSSMSTIILTASLLHMLNLKAQSSRIIISATRMSVQLVVMGLFVLTPLFAFASTSPWRIASWITIVAILASREAKSRSKYRYKGQMRDCFLAIFGGVGLTLAHLVAFVLHPPFSRTKMSVNAQTIIPIAGMLFGSALSATTLGMSILLGNFLEGGRGRVELRLARGANVWEAALPAVREAVEAALMPTVNAMAAAGIIFMPGMMTGQILGGQSPAAAAAHQSMIYFAIAASRTLTATFLALILTARMFDLRRQALVPWRQIPGLLRTNSANDIDGKITQFSEPRQHSMYSFVSKANSEKEPANPILQVNQLTVESTYLHVPFLEIRDGDRIGISGVSGIGKSQLLRALARLDPLSPGHKTIDTNNTISLQGQSFDNILPACWRSEVMWVCQDRPTLTGSPRDFYHEILGYRSQLHSKRNDHTLQSPMEIAQDWNLPAKTWDQPWDDVSGGEAQRLSLAIALALQPQLMLLDEPTSSCDAQTTMLIEKTLVERNATIVMVSHSDEQLQRFCHSMVRLHLTRPN